MEIPGHGLVGGEWDLRGSENTYLGHVDFEDCRVLEIGTASGYLCFHMERMGAEVVAFDLDPNLQWDIVPLHQNDYRKLSSERKQHLVRLRNGFWFAHKAFGSNAKVAYGTAYDIPGGIGEVDIVTLCSVLLHLRDPFLAMQNAARMARQTLIITELHPDQQLIYPPASRLRYLLSPLKRKLLGASHPGYGAEAPYAQFLPDSQGNVVGDAWWLLAPETVRRIMGVLGFEDSDTTYHSHTHSSGGPRKFFTIVAQRTRANVLRDI